MKQIVLVGNPNVGKTTLYNNLTKSFEHIGNWHGVTVGQVEKIVKHNGNEYEIIDLPGAYSLNPFSLEEKVTTDFIKQNNDAIFICIIESNNIKRNLYLVVQLLELNKKVILLINEKNKKNSNFDIKQLKKQLKIDILLLNFKKERKFNELYVAIDSYKNSIMEFDYIKKYPIEQLNGIFKTLDKTNYLYLSMRFLDGDYSCLQNGIFTNLEYNNLLNYKNLNDYAMDLALDRYTFIEGMLQKKCNKKIENNKKTIKNNKKSGNFEWFLKNNLKVLKNKNIIFKKQNDANRIQKSFNFKNRKLKDNNNYTDKNSFIRDNTFAKHLDKIVLNKYLAIPIFLLIMLIVFYITFSSLGAFISSKFEWFVIDFVGGELIELVNNNCKIEWIQTLFSNAIVGGVGSVLVFLPQIILLFLFLTLLEESGYISRVAYAMEGIFSKIGLSGKSVFSWLMGFGCSASAVMTAQNLESKNAKLKTILTTPYMPCNAKLPVFAVLGGAFFGNGNIFLIFGLYIFSASVGVIIAYLYELTLLKKEKLTFVMEFPNYQLPFTKDLVKSVCRNTKNFISRVGGFIICFSIVIWIFQSFDFSLHYIANEQNSISIMQTLATLFAPIFAPLGFGNWGAVSCLFAGIIAKELIVSTMGIINNVNDFSGDASNLIGASVLLSTSPIFFDLASCLSFLTFVTLYAPCIATFSTMRAEIGLKWTLFNHFSMTVVAYIISYIIYKIALLFSNFGFVYSLCVILFIILFCILCIHLIVKLFKKKCKKCNKHCDFC